MSVSYFFCIKEKTMNNDAFKWTEIELSAYSKEQIQICEQKQNRISNQKIMENFNLKSVSNIYSNQINNYRYHLEA